VIDNRLMNMRNDEKYEQFVLRKRGSSSNRGKDRVKYGNIVRPFYISDKKERKVRYPLEGEHEVSEWYDLSRYNIETTLLS